MIKLPTPEEVRATANQDMQGIYAANAKLLALAARNEVQAIRTSQLSTDQRVNELCDLLEFLMARGAVHF